MQLARLIRSTLKSVNSIRPWFATAILILIVTMTQVISYHASVAAQALPTTTNVSYVPKEHPPIMIAGKNNMSLATTANGDGYCGDGSCSYWTTMADQGFIAAGASVKIRQSQPKVGSKDYHSLAELAVESPDDQQIVEVGWIVARDVNGDSLTHLFVYHWVNGEGTCFNGCGFVPTTTTYKAGGTVKVGTTGSYAISYSGSAWVVTYNGVELGYFPESLWGGSFTTIGVAQVFGEVSSSSPTRPLSQMGNGILGTSTKGATMSAFNLINANVKPTLSYADAQAPMVYKIGHYNTACTSSCAMNFGGPGY